MAHPLLQGLRWYPLKDALCSKRLAQIVEMYVLNLCCCHGPVKRLLYVLERLPLAVVKKIRAFGLSNGAAGGATGCPAAATATTTFNGIAIATNVAMAATIISGSGALAKGGTRPMLPGGKIANIGATIGLRPVTAVQHAGCVLST